MDYQTGMITILCRGLSKTRVETEMLDLIYIAATILFFLIALAYVRGCEKLQ
jgi:hypothetical protein